MDIKQSPTTSIITVFWDTIYIRF